MEQTAVIANLPNLEVRVVHRDMPEEGAEIIGIQLKATPSFDALAEDIAASLPPLPWLLPVQLWMEMLSRTWAPWMAMAATPLGGWQRKLPR